MKRFALLALALALPLAGCAASPLGPGADPDASAPDATESHDDEANAEGLVGMWRVAADGADDATWLRLDAQEAMVWSECGVRMGTWVAAESLFLASTFGTVGCDDPSVPWLEQTAGYRASPDGWELVDADGAVTASLTIDGAPEPHPDLIADYAEPPVLTDQDRAHFAAPEPLPTGLEPADAASLEGRWVPAESTPTEPFIEFTHREWTGSDGCNGNSGRWAVGVRGQFLATTGPQTLIYCEGAPIAVWMGEARSAGFDGDNLVLVDADGVELGRLVR